MTGGRTGVSCVRMNGVQCVVVAGHDPLEYIHESVDQSVSWVRQASWIGPRVYMMTRDRDGFLRPMRLGLGNSLLVYTQFP